MNTTPNTEQTPPRSSRVTITNTARKLLIATIGILLFAAACASSDSTRHQARQPADNQQEHRPANQQPVKTEQPHYEIVLASGYLTDLLGGGSVGVGYDYGPLEGASSALRRNGLIVAGYLVDIVPGVIWKNTTVYDAPTKDEIERSLERLDEREARLRESGSWDIMEEATFARLRMNIRSARPRPVHHQDHSAYRVKVTEVLSGDFKVGDVLDVQVLNGLRITAKKLKSHLVGTPRVVVGGNWHVGRPGPSYELRDSSDALVTEPVFYPAVDLFWLDESVWDITDVGTGTGPGGVGSTDQEAAGGGEVPGNLLDDDDPPTSETEAEDVLERPAGGGEAMYLDGLHDLHPAWGTIETLDDLAYAIRAAAKASTEPTEATSAVEETSDTTSTVAEPTTTVVTTTTADTGPGDHDHDHPRGEEDHDHDDGPGGDTGPP